MIHLPGRLEKPSILSGKVFGKKISLVHDYLFEKDHIHSAGVCNKLGWNSLSLCVSVSPPVVVGDNWRRKS